jgi:hypothetical protein
MAANPSRHTVHYVNLVHPIIHPTVLSSQLLVSLAKSMEMVNYAVNKGCLNIIRNKRWTPQCTLKPTAL